mmetsp:Transcript_13435/g.26591  ORF Transcript_13435/g.26591 Transcript_13435/m.26591 type:complete len:204 (-) Transcript_13435:423-1034(-)
MGQRERKINQASKQAQTECTRKIIPFIIIYLNPPTYPFPCFLLRVGGSVSEKDFQNLQADRQAGSRSNKQAGPPTHHNQPTKHRDTSRISSKHLFLPLSSSPPASSLPLLLILLFFVFLSRSVIPSYLSFPIDALTACLSSLRASFLSTLQPFLHPSIHPSIDPPIHPLASLEGSGREGSRVDWRSKGVVSEPLVACQPVCPS